MDVTNGLMAVEAQVIDLKKRCQAAIDELGARAKFDQIDVDVDPRRYCCGAIDEVKQWLQLHKHDSLGRPEHWIVKYQTGLSGTPYLRFWQNR